jgi:hypothetical protein
MNKPTQVKPGQPLSALDTSTELDSVEADLGTIFGPPPLLSGESEANYRALYQRIRGAIEPADLIEQLWVRDVADLFWETLRLRRLKATLMTVAAHQGVRSLLDVLQPSDYSLAKEWGRREPGALKRVDKMLVGAGLGDEAISAQTLSVKLDTFDRIDHADGTPA